MKSIDDRIKTIFPPYGDIWNMLVDNANAPFIKPHEKWKLWGAVCLRDIADLLQTSRKHFRAAVIAYNKSYRHLPKRNRPFAKVYFFRESYDYAVVCLVSASYSYAAALCHFHLRINEPEDFYPTPKSIRKWIRERDYIPRCLAIPVLKEMKLFNKHRPFNAITKYRNAWVHGGYPLIKGEVRRTRRDVFADRSLIESTFGHYGNGWPFVATEVPEHTVYDLLRNSSKSYCFLLSRIVSFFRVALSQDAFAKYKIPSALAFA